MVSIICTVYPFGRFLHRIWKDAADEINREDQNKEKKD